MCGLAAYIGTQDPDVMKLRILLLYNEVRGGDATGVYLNNEVIKDGEKHKKSTDFISHYELEYNPESNNKLFMAHTRKGSVGSGTTENAHPHLINNDLVLEQNGTIKNIWALCNKYEVPHINITNDTKALALLIDKVGFSILNEYIGFASLIFSRISEPNVLYVFKGASKQYSGTKVEEERPLFFINDKETNEIFFSSLEDSLYAVTNNSFKVINVLPNYVYRIDFESGKLNMKAIFKSNRGETDINVGVNTHGATTYKNNPYNNYGAYDHSYGDYGKKLTHRFLPAKKEPTIPFMSLAKKPVEKEKRKKDVARYVAYDHKILTEQIVFVSNFRYVCMGKLMQGCFHITNNGIVMNGGSQETLVYYFINGVMIENAIMYNLLTRDTKHEKNTTNCNFALFISAFSKFPVSHSSEDDDFSERENVFYFRSKIVKNALFRMPFSKNMDFIRTYNSEPLEIKTLQNIHSSVRRLVVAGDKGTLENVVLEEYTQLNYSDANNTIKRKKEISKIDTKSVNQQINNFLKITHMITLLDEVLEEIEDFYSFIKVSEMICIHLYIEDSLVNEVKSREEISKGLRLVVTDAIDKGYTIREFLQENQVYIEEFMPAAIEELELLKTGHTMTEIRELYDIDYFSNLKQDACGLVEKPKVYNGNIQETEDEFEEEETEEELNKLTYDDTCDNVIDILDTMNACIKDLDEIKNPEKIHTDFKNVILSLSVEFTNTITNFFDEKKDSENKTKIANKIAKYLNYF